MANNPESGESLSAAAASCSPSPAPGCAPKAYGEPSTQPPLNSQTVPSLSDPTRIPQDRTNTVQVPVLDIDLPCDSNGRTYIDPDKVAWLANAIQETGLLHPITLAPNGNRYNLIAGCHRLQAHIRLKRHMIDAVLIDASEAIQARIRLQENVARTELTPVEEALQLAAIMDMGQTDVERLAAELGRSVNWVLDRLDMAAWPSALLEHVHNRRIAIKAATYLSKIEPDWRRAELVSFAAQSGVSSRVARNWLEQSKTPEFAQANPTPAGEPADLRQFTTTVEVTCFVCRGQTPITQAKPAHVCDACLVNLNTAPQ